MRTQLDGNLELIPLPRAREIGDYDSFDIETVGIQVGKARCRIEGAMLTIFSIGIYPEFQRRGYATAVIDHFKRKYSSIIADRVRYSARPFWQAMGFREEADSGDFSWRTGDDRPKSNN